MLGAVQGQGYAPETATVVFPTPLFMVGSDLTPVRERIDEFVYGLTKWQPKVKEKGIQTAPKVTVEGKDYQDAVDKMGYKFLMNLWGDGLPIIPPTEERVSWILTGTDLPRNTEIGRISPRGGIAPVEAIAVALAMAGGRPEYLPVLIATVEALVTPQTALSSWQAGSASAFPAVIVNGPIGQQIRLNSGFGLLGPHPQYPAGGAIGRAIRFLLAQVGGAVPGIQAAAQYAHMRYTNVVFAEDEAYLPPGWEPLNTEYFGHPKGTNAVTTLACEEVKFLTHRGSGLEPSLEVEQLESQIRAAQVMAKVPKGIPGTGQNNTLIPPGTYMAGILFFNTLTAGQMAECGWTKKKIKEDLWERTKVPLSVLMARPDLVRDHQKAGIDIKTLPDPVPLWDKPERIIIAVAGGRHPSASLWMTSSLYSGAMGSAKINLPAKPKWDSLLAQAEKDLGPIATW